MTRNHSTRRLISPVLFWYVTREITVPLVCCLGGFAALFLIADVFDVLQDFIEAKTPLLGMIRFFVLRQPANLVNALPMAALLSASFATSNLGRHHEITAVRTAGISMIHCFLPVWLAALLLSGFSFWLGEAVVPQSASRSERLLDELTEKPSARRARGAVLAFRNAQGDRDWFFEEFSLDGEQAGVVVKQFRPSERVLVREVRARSARYVDDRWVFATTTVVEYDADGVLPVGPERRFETYADEGIRETPTEILNSLRPTSELTLSDMWRLLSYHRNLPQSTRDVLRTTIWHRLAFPFACLIGALLGVALAIAPERCSALRGFALAVGTMALYHVVSQAFVLLGKHGMVPPFVGGGLPTLVFAGWGGWELHRRR